MRRYGSRTSVSPTRSKPSRRPCSTSWPTRHDAPRLVPPTAATPSSTTSCGASVLSWVPPSGRPPGSSEGSVASAWPCPAAEGLADLTADLAQDAEDQQRQRGPRHVVGDQVAGDEVGGERRPARQATDQHSDRDEREQQ